MRLAFRRRRGSRPNDPLRSAQRSLNRLEGWSLTDVVGSASRSHLDRLRIPQTERSIMQVPKKDWKPGDDPYPGEDEQSYADLCDEMSDPSAHPWNEEDWDEHAVACAKRFAHETGRSWPPRMGDFDLWYDEKHNS